MQGGVRHGGIAFLSVSRDGGGEFGILATETQNDGSERSAGLAENAFWVLVAQASGGVESDAIAGRSAFEAENRKSVSLHTGGSNF
jgi:hypothetical protein